MPKPPAPLTCEQLRGRIQRLKIELTAAYSAVPWHVGYVDRLVHDLAESERELEAQLAGAFVDTEPAALAPRFDTRDERNPLRNVH